MRRHQTCKQHGGFEYISLTDRKPMRSVCITGAQNRCGVIEFMCVGNQTSAASGTDCSFPSTPSHTPISSQKGLQRIKMLQRLGIRICHPLLNPGYATGRVPIHADDLCLAWFNLSRFLRFCPSTVRCRLRDAALQLGL